MINKLSKEIHAINVKNGFYEHEKNIGEMLCLIHSEVSEALECDRQDQYSNIIDLEAKALLEEKDNAVFKAWFKEEVKDSFEDELADVMIRVMDLADFKGIDLEFHIKAKMRYNSLRAYKHGKKY